MTSVSHGCEALGKRTREVGGGTDNSELPPCKKSKKKKSKGADSQVRVGDTGERVLLSCLMRVGDTVQVPG